MSENEKSLQADSSMLLLTYFPERKNDLQFLNDFCIFINLSLYLQFKEISRDCYFINKKLNFFGNANRKGRLSFFSK